MKPETKEKKYLIKEFDRHGYKLTFSQSRYSGNNINTLKELLQRVSEGKQLL